MSDILRTDIQTYYTNQDINSTQRIDTDEVINKPSNFSYGLQSLDSGQQSFVLFENTNYAVIKSNLPISLEIGDSCILSDITFFCYKSDTPINISASNDNDESVNIKYIFATEE